MRDYIVNPEYAAQRVEGEDAETIEARIDAARKAWKPLSQRGDKVGFCGNFAGDLGFNKDTGLVERRGPNFHLATHVGVYQVISSALMLYRLACVFKPRVEFNGREAYKCMWSAAFRNKTLGIDILFYEWKGGLTIGLRLSNSTSRLDAFTDAQYAAALSLVNLLVTPNLTHPYDGCVAGSVA